VAPLRIVDPEGLYHVMSRGNYRRTIFPDEGHASRYLLLLDRVASRRDWIVVDWCLMPNHYHLLIRLTDGGLSEGMRELNGCYSRWSNAMHELTGTGHLVRNRFKSPLVDSDEYVLRVLRYIPRNPVASNFAVAPAAWRWSGYRANLGLEHPQPFHRPHEVLTWFSSRPAEARRLYRLHVEGGPDPPGLDPWSDHGNRTATAPRG
jgi:REP element-mobilizing transposase RayT